MLNCFNDWTAAVPGIDTRKLIWGHTAFSLYALFDYSDYVNTFSSEKFVASTSRGLRPGSFRQCKLQHPLQTLRYCPVCAAEQRKIYGESYWQVLPQLDGVEYCPFHLIPIQSSGIRIRDLRYAFHPADSILHISKPRQDSGGLLSLNELQAIVTPDVFISMARCVLFLWEHLPAYSGIWFLIAQYRKLLTVELENSFWQSTYTLKTKLLEKNHPRLVNWLLSSGLQHTDPSYIFYSGFSLAQHALMISLISNSPESFFAA